MDEPRQEVTEERSSATVLEMVQEFQTKFDVSKDPALWETLIAEELAEAQEAAAQLLKELADVAYVVIGYYSVGGNMEQLDKRVVAGLQILHQVSQAFPQEIQIDAIKRVHASNMSKLGDDGKPVRREDGKVLKGPNYKAPDLLELVKP